jgi:DMSO/TMAO reductase YedYZ molybdopterin-dependent catalytic subunit
MKRRQKKQWARIAQHMLLMPIVPVLGIGLAGGREFPTRTVEEDTFYFHPGAGMIRWKENGTEQPFTLLIDGLVEVPVELSYSNLLSLEQSTQITDFHCVEGWTVPEVEWSGIRFKELLDRVRPLPHASHVVFHALGKTSSSPRGQSHYIEAFRLSDLLDPAQKIMLALKMNGKPLSAERGAPLRVIAPYRQAYKSIKFVSRVEFAEEMREGWWTLANPIYDVDAAVPEDRLVRKGRKVE